MNYFNFLAASVQERIFCHAPTSFSKCTEPAILRKAVGGLLYIPGTRQDIAKILIEGRVRGLVSMAICLEDAVGDMARQAAVENVLSQLGQIYEALEHGTLSLETLPLLFIRVKDSVMLEQLSTAFVSYSKVISGAILPKTTRSELERALVLGDAIASNSQDPFYIMPILESDELMLENDRISLLQELLGVMDHHSGRVLNVRVGATDLCGLYGIRRGVDTPIYGVPVISGCISDVVRVFGLRDRYTVSGPVWEFFSSSQLTSGGQLAAEVSGLLREVGQDSQNGILGKTCIHPSQVLPVQASYVVPYERYQDATAVAGGDRYTAGVLSSARHNKMNELKPHILWAQKTLQQAAIYGVFQEGIGVLDLLHAAWEAEGSL